MSGTEFLRRRRPARRLRTVPPVHSLRRERNTKRRGELAELVFLLIATRLGFGVSKPYGDSERYDFILDPREIAGRNGARVGTGASPVQAERSSAQIRGRGVRRVGNPNQSKTLCHSDRREEPAFPAGAPFLACSVREKWGFSPLYRIQVKCSTQLVNGLYRVNAHRRSGRRAVPYLPGEIDFIAAYIIPEDTWYIIPLHAVRGASLLFRRKKDRRPGLYDQYRQAWHLLRSK